MSTVSNESDRCPAAPFLLQVFYRNGGFYKSEDFSLYSLPPHISVYTWPSCTLDELALELAAAKPSILPYPAIGTRLAFQLACPDLRGTGAVSNTQPRYAFKDLGSIVIGHHNSGAGDANDIEMGGSTRVEPASTKSLSDARFVVGDYISCAILPPLADGSVAPASVARRESNAAHRDGRAPRGGGRGGFHGRQSDFDRSSNRESRGGSWSGAGAGAGAALPMGEWRRGERLPEMSFSRPRGGGRGGRW